MNKENCALKLVNKIILYYDAWSKKHQFPYVIFLFMYKMHFWWFDFQKAVNRQLCYLCFMTSYLHMQYRKYILLVNSFIHLVFCLTTRPKPLPKRALHIVRSRASSFKWEYPPLFLRSSSSFLRLLLCLPVTYIPPSIFPSLTLCRRQFLPKKWPIKLAFLLLISRRILLCSLTLSNTSSFLTWSVQLIFSILLQHRISKLSRCY